MEEGSYSLSINGQTNLPNTSNLKFHPWRFPSILTVYTVNNRLLPQMLLLLVVMISVAEAHLSISYPRSRGCNLAKNGTVGETNGLSVATTTTPDGSDEPIYPYGMQFLYPCTS